MKPRLIHAVAIEVQPLDRSATAVDVRQREPVKILKRLPTLSLQAQIQWQKRSEPDAGRGGAIRHDSGYLVCLVSKLAQVGWTPMQGDKITRAGAITGLNVYVTGTEPCMHYDGQHLGLVINFADKQPVRT